MGHCTVKSMPPEASKYSVPNLERALEIVELLSLHREGLIVAHLARELDFPRNSVFRICATLVDRGYLQYFRDTQQLCLTRKLFAVGYRALLEDNIVELARDAMRSLRDEFKETVVIGALMETEGAVLDELPGLHHFNFRIERGASFYLHCTAPGKALLAYLGASELEQMMGSIKFEAFNANTITDMETYQKALEQVRVDGFGYDRAEQIEGCHCIAAPIFDQYGYPVAAIWITGPSSRLPEADFTQIGLRVKAAADSISNVLGHQRETVS
jgi:DNA-binding IclR family transcriptional regulator